MSNYKIITDTACDIPLSYFEENNVDFVPFSISFDSQNYKKDLVDITTDEFYEKLKDKSVFPKTSQPTIQDYLDVFQPYVDAKEDILCICLSSKLSGSYQSAINAKNLLEDEKISSKIEVIDSLCVTGSGNLLVIQAVEMRDKGYSIEEQVKTINEIKNTAKIFFTVDSLEHLQKGGRIGKAASLAGSILNIKPILSIQEGEIIPIAKVRGHKKSIQCVIDKAIEEVSDSKEDYIVNTLYGGKELIETSKSLLTVLKENNCNISPMESGRVGVTIGSHTGPTAVGIALMKKYDKV